MLYEKLYKLLSEETTQQFSDMFWKLTPSSVVEVRYNLNIFSYRSSYNTLFTVGGFVPKPLSEREAEVDIRVLENHDGDFVDDDRK